MKTGVKLFTPENQPAPTQTKPMTAGWFEQTVQTVLNRKCPGLAVWLMPSVLEDDSRCKAEAHQGIYTGKGEILRDFSNALIIFP
jgi:hypothetical protein